MRSSAPLMLMAGLSSCPTADCRGEFANTRPVTRSAPTHGSQADGLRLRWFEPAAHRARSLLGAMAMLGLVGACSAGAPGGAPAIALTATRLGEAPAAVPETLMTDDATPALDAVLIQHVPEGTFGPYVGTSPDGRAVAVWAAVTPETGRRWFSVSLDAKGAPLGETRSLADAPGDLALATVTATLEGFVVLATGMTSTGTRLEALRLGKEGELIAGPTPIAHSRTEVLWIEALNVGRNMVALWATLAVGSADIHWGTLNATGAPLAQPLRVLEGGRAWQAVAFGDGVALAAVIAGPAETSRGLRVLFLDAEGRLLDESEVTSGTKLEAQLDAARIGDNLVLSWVERDDLEERLYLAALGSDTRLVVGPQPASAPFGRQRLLEIVPGSDRRTDAILVWENIGQAPGGQQRLQLGRLSDQAKLGAERAELSYAGEVSARPELARKGKGVVCLTRAAPCALDGRPCASSDPVPTFVEFSSDLQVIASEPVRLAAVAGQPANLAWGLRCHGDTCSALGALPATPVPVYGIELRARSGAWPAVARRVTDALPRALELRAIAETDLLADVAAARAGSGWLVASLTQFDESTPYVRRTTPAPDGRLAPVRAVLSVQPIGPDGAESGAARVISYRARSSNGVALVPAPDERVLLAWSALDRQRPEVFATLLGRSGQPLFQRMLTLGAGNVTHVAAAALPQGYIVSWIADRNGEPRAFAARLTSDLGRGAPEQQLGQTPGPAAGLSLLPRGDGAWLASVHDAGQEHVLSVTRLDPKTAAPQGVDIEIRRSATSALVSPSLAARGEGAMLAWIERPSPARAESARAWLVELGADARRKGEPVAVASTAANPIAVRLFCKDELCQGVVDYRPPSGPLLEGFGADTLDPAPNGQLLIRRASATSDPPTFALTDTAIFYADREEQRGFLRRVAVAWR